MRITRKVNIKFMYKWGSTPGDRLWWVTCDKSPDGSREAKITMVVAITKTTMKGYDGMCLYKLIVGPLVLCLGVSRSAP